MKKQSMSLSIVCVCKIKGVKEKLLIEKDKYYEDVNQLIVGCIYVIAQDTKEGSLKTVDIIKSVQKVNHVLEQMNLVMKNNALEETNPIL